jgi:hypothetical protein
MTEEKKEIKANHLPISFAEFAKEPVKGMLFLVIIAIGYLYIDGKTMNLKRSDSLLSASLARLTTLQELGKIK